LLIDKLIFGLILTIVQQLDDWHNWKTTS